MIRRPLLALAAAVLLAGCGSLPRLGGEPAPDPAATRALALRLLPARIDDREGWADDLVPVFGALRLEPGAAQLCAVMAVIEQESSWRADPVVPNLPRIALKEIEDRAARLRVPRALVHAALRIESPTGATYRQRIDAARTERQLSEIFEDFIGEVPLGRRLLADYNPVRTGGPMQVSIAWSRQYAKDHGYPFGTNADIRREVFTRRGGLYFGTAHLLAYPADYDSLVYRYADFNAGQYASRNAGFQAALNRAAGAKLALDGDLLLRGDRAGEPSQTELAARRIAGRLGLTEVQIREQLSQGEHPEFGETAIYRRVFELADRAAGTPVPRAVIPQIRLRSPKITRELTTAWFAQRVQERQQRCVARAAGNTLR